MNKSDEYGINKVQLEQLFQNFRLYRDTLNREIFDIDPSLMPFLKENFLGHSLGTTYLDHSLAYKNGESLNVILNDFVTSFFSYVNDKDIIPIKNLKDFIREVNLTDLTSDQKMIMINFYSDHEEISRKLLLLYNHVSSLMEKHEAIISNEVLQGFDENCERLINQIFFKDLSDKKRVDILPAIFPFNEISIIDNEDHFTVRLGYLHFALDDLKKKNMNDDNRMAEILKALGDATRFKILNLLLQKKSYLQEISGAISLTPATVTYHLDYLMRMNLIDVSDISVDHKRIYYEINHQTFRRINERLNLFTKEK
jgi:DNA-binding transcriptional ArsR family regulator